MCYAPLHILQTQYTFAHAYTYRSTLRLMRPSTLVSQQPNLI